MIANCSSSRSKRSATGGNDIPYAAVLLLVPPGAEAQLDTPPAHGVDCRHRDGKWSREPEGGGREQGPEPDPLGVAGEAGERRPGVARAGHAVDRAHLEVVVGAEECPEAAFFGSSGHAEQLFVARSLLGLGEDPEFHGRGSSTLGGAARRASGSCAGGLGVGRVSAHADVAQW